MKILAILTVATLLFAAAWDVANEALLNYGSGLTHESTRVVP